MTRLEGSADFRYDFVRNDAVRFLKDVDRVDAFTINSRESYAEMNWGIEFVLKTNRETAGPTYLLALIKALMMVGEAGPQVFGTKGNNREHFHHAADSKGSVVLVGIPERVKHQKPRRNREVVSVIRLAPFDSLEELRRQSLERWVGFAKESNWVIVDGETGSKATDLRRRETPQNIVQGRSHVVNALGGEKSKVGVGVLADVSLEDIALALRVVVGRGTIRFAEKELGFLGLEFVELSPCSIKPSDWPVYWVHSQGAATLGVMAPSNKPDPKTQQTPKGYEIPVPKRGAVLGDLKRVAKAPKLKRG